MVIELMRQTVVVVIPIYKASVTRNEEISLRQCFAILGNHPVCFLTHTALATAFYEKIADEYRVRCSFRYFDIGFFSDVSGYNKLMLSRDFYDSFADFEYMLIYQLDAYVFSDQLISWCEAGYDYVGAPWITAEGTLLGVGNGGFSLRNIRFFRRIFRVRGNINSFKSLISDYAAALRRSPSPFKSIKETALLTLRIFGYRESISYALSHTTKNEDWFWYDCFACASAKIRMRVPSETEALRFSFEMAPSMLFEINDKRLPFGCHAWDKYDRSFWSSFIPQELQ